jgi:2-oxoglutarate dehydrogenase E2 component (dihydrolipoamide succinyltransferase)
MKVDVVMPKMGESLQEGTIIKWHKKPGDRVERDETILEISTDKVDTEVPSPAAGIITKLLFEENTIVEVGKVIAEIETEAGETQIESPAQVTAAAPVKTIEEPAPAPVVAAPVQPIAVSGGDMADVVMPKMGESLQEGTIIKWHKKPGDKVERDETILEISTDKVDTEVPSPVAGIVAELLAEEGQTIEVGKVIARISTGGATVIATASPAADPAPVVAAPVSAEPAAVKVPVKSEGKRFYSPLVKSIAKENNIGFDELDNIEGSGLENRVSKKDILAYLETRKTQKVSAPAPASPAVTAHAPAISKPTTVAFGDDVEVIPMDRVRQLIADHMVYSKQTSAHVTSVGEADVTQIVKYRENHKDEFEKREGIKLTYTPFFAKATIDGLTKYPMVNVSVEGKNILRHKRINLGMATALPDGNLIVPVIKSADALSMTGLQRAVTDLATRARSKKLNPDDIQGGTFTITNYGTAGTLFGSPIINQPQTAILGLGAIQKRPVVREINGEHLIVIRDMTYISLTYDHRVIDGQLAGMILQAIIKSLESMNEETIRL